MTDENIVAVYDTQAHAEAAAATLRNAGVPASAIALHANAAASTGTATTASTAPREQGFWATLFGGDSTDSTVYDRSLESGSTLLTVRVPDTSAARVMHLLEDTNPVDIDERATTYGLAAAAPAAPAAPPRATQAATASRPVANDQTLQLAEEQLRVGKRVVNRGGARIRRYVVETPVEENITLHSERVQVERRPVTDSRPVENPSFTEKVVEASAVEEEPVVSKTAHVYEEVGLRKEATDRVETIRDTVRKEQAEIEQLPADTSIPPAGAAAKPRTPKI